MSFQRVLSAAPSKKKAVRRAERADQLVHLGDFSSARQVLESAELVHGTPETLRQLRAKPTQPLPLLDDIVGHDPDVEFQLDPDRFKRNVLSAKRGAAGGPSGMTMEHLRTLLDSPRDTQSLYVVCELFVRGAVPNSIRDQKPSGGVRGIVTGDVIRRVVARTIAQQISEAVEAATKAGCECVAHAVQALTEQCGRFRPHFSREYVEAS